MPARTLLCVVDESELPLRDRVGLAAGEVNVYVDGAGTRVEPIASDDVEEQEGRVVVPKSGVSIDDELVRALRDADQR